MAGLQFEFCVREAALGAAEIRALLRLEAHPLEGGFYAETWRGSLEIPGASLGAANHGPRSIGTAIYYLFTPETGSSMHRLRWDEIFHFYLGDPVEMLLLEPGREGCVATLGTDLRAGQRPQLVVTAGVWQGARLAAGGRVALLGTTMAPGFDPADFEHGRRTELVADWPRHSAAITALTRS
ncbi:MAG: cupin domain-containing protein [Candidatus Eisenbacteria bacterium]